MRSSYLLVVIVMDSRSSSLSSGCEEKRLGEVHGSVGVLSFVSMGEHDCSKLSNSVLVIWSAIELAKTKSVPRIPEKDGGCPSG